MMIAENTSTSQAEDFLVESGVLQSITLDAVAVGLRRKLTSEGAVCCVHRDGRLRLRALLARRWHWSDAERIESRMVGAILAMNPYARVQGVQLRKRGRYIEAEIGVT